MVHFSSTLWIFCVQRIYVLQLENKKGEKANLVKTIHRKEVTGMPSFTL